MKYAALQFGTVEAVFNKLGGIEGAQRFLRGETMVVERQRTWCEHNGVIYFSVTSNGMTGEQWITHLESKGYEIGDPAKSMLRSPDFKPTNGVRTDIAVLRDTLFEDSDRVTSKIRAFAAERKLTAPNSEVACLIREMLSDKEIQAMGLWWIVSMHEPIEAADGKLCWLYSNLGDDADEGCWLHAYSTFKWVSGFGFAFAATPTAPTPAEWTTDNEGNIHFTVTSNGMTREEWERSLESRGWRIGDYARKVLRCTSELPTSGVAYHIVVRPGKQISAGDRITKKIRAHAEGQGWKTPHWEVACLIRDAFTDDQLEKMGLCQILTMHEPIKVSNGVPGLLTSRRRDGGRWLAGYDEIPDDRWIDDLSGFAFVVPQVSSEN